MALSVQYVTEWQNWHKQRIADLNRPYGFLSVVSQDWLPADDMFTSDFVPGAWALKAGEIWYHPDPAATARGEMMIVDGVPAVEPTCIPHGYNRNSGTGSGVPLFFGDLEVETITRVNARGETIYAVRVRDPREVASKRFDEIETFPLSEKWIVPARFTAVEVVLHEAPTVEDGLYEAIFTLGSVQVEIDGKSYDLEVSGHRGGSAATGYFVDSILMHFGDKTNGKETYGGGRVILFGSQSELESLTQIDFNRAVSLPCALSTFVACTSTPQGSRFPFRVEAGEYTPPVPHERVATYHG